jgi:hypothetical protein
MHAAAGNKTFVAQSLLHVTEQVSAPSWAVSDAISYGSGPAGADEIEHRRSLLSSRLREATANLQAEPAHSDAHYVSRFSGVGIFQSALSAIFADLPDLQRYGDKNPIWVTTLIEEIAHKVKAFFERAHEDRTGKKQPLWAALASELVRIGQADDRAPYPKGAPQVQAREHGVLHSTQPHGNKTHDAESLRRFCFLKAELLVEFIVWLAVDLDIRINEVIERWAILLGR